ncbi:MAG: folate family ECF transporter S component [Lachnospiraceae bacterium]|nr:folate family ECF transporter S component [Lachnospiraceae bacterium]MBR5733546.1 folate family ECF transporter S component [Lachnospiraceae bacterium]
MERSRHFTVIQLVTDAMLCAICAVLGYLAIDLTSIKITFESLPILIAALLFGPVDGITVGAVGTLIYQYLRYGFTATTFLWMLPYIVLGFIAGFYAKKKNFRINATELGVLTVICELVVTLLNTLVILIDSKIYGWYYPTLITGSLVIRLIVCIAKAIVFGVILYPLLTAIRRNGGLKYPSSQSKPAKPEVSEK